MKARRFFALAGACALVGSIVAIPAQAAPSPVASPSWWTPTKSTTFQYALSVVDTKTNVKVVFMDGEDATARQVTAVHNAGRKAVCYISAGTWEDWRSDATSFPASVLGSAVDDWPGERWLDIRAKNTLIALMEKRVSTCKAKGFDAVDFDNVDAYTNKSGFPLTGAHQIAYNTALANLAHSKGLGVGLKNDVDQAAQLVSVFDFAVNEQCLQYNECKRYQPFLKAGKVVFHIEYRDDTAFCSDPRRAGLTSIAKRMELGTWLLACP